MKKRQQDIRLLPRYFNYVALVIFIVSLLTGLLLLMKTVSVEKDVVKSGLLISFLLFSVTKDKTEDELTMKLRLLAFTSAFVYGVVIALVFPFLHFLSDGKYISNQSASSLLLSMLLFYLLVFYFFKRKR